MPDNVVLNLGTGGDTIAADDIGGAKYQIVKVAYGADGSVTQVSAANPLPSVAATDVSNLYSGSTALVPKFARFSSASTGNQALVAAVVGKKIRVLALHVLATASTNAVFINDGTADLYADATRKIPLDATGAAGPGGFSLPFNPVGWFETAATNRAININLGSANGVVAVATYVEV